MCRLDDLERLRHRNRAPSVSCAGKFIVSVFLSSHLFPGKMYPIEFTLRGTQLNFSLQWPIRYRCWQVDSMLGKAWLRIHYTTTKWSSHTGFHDVNGHQNQHFVITGKVFLLLFWAIESSFLVHGGAPCVKSMTTVKWELSNLWNIEMWKEEKKFEAGDRSKWGTRASHLIDGGRSKVDI
jgi:hypothetical protein